MKHVISLAAAIELTGNFRANPAPDVATCETFEKNSVIKMLSTPGAVSLRIYSGRKENQQVCAVMCAVDENGEDILPVQKRAGEETQDGDEEILILEDSHRCPELCPPPSPLNN
jgi:hypothetical protein